MEKRQEYICAIQRELDKREIAYPKMLKKMSKRVESNEATIEQYIEMQNSQAEQEQALRGVKETIKGSEWGTHEGFFNIDGIKELVREMDMRLRYYPIMIIKHQISKEDAKKEKQIWRELIEYFNEYYTPRVTVVYLKTRCRIQS